MLQLGQTANGLLDGKRDLRLDLFRTERRDDRVDLHLHRRRVGEGVNVHVLDRDPARNGERQRGEDDDRAVMQAEVDDVSEHICFQTVSRRR